MTYDEHGRPIEILLVEDNPGDVRLTIEALKEGKVRNNLSRREGRRGGAGVPAPRGEATRTRPGRT